MMDTSTIDASAAAEAIVEAAGRIASMPGSTRWEFLWNAFTAFLPKLLTALLILVIGAVAVRMLVRFSRALLQKSKLDPTLHSFAISMLNITLYVILGVIVLTELIPKAAAGLVALMGVFGLAISLAVKDSLANLASGMSVLFTKPFALGDYVKINASEGTIQEIRLNYTVIKTFDNKVIHIPNGDVAKAEIVNFTCEPTRRLDLNFSIGYQDDFERAETIISDILRDSPLALAEPEPIVRMVEHAASAVKIGCKVWCLTPDYWPLHFDLLEEVKRRFDAAGITIPYGQMDVHLRGGAEKTPEGLYRDPEGSN